eukprot:CAMPEP_0179202448 /NCGR_PEP_ID=MMETSP0796-20121207/100840_1 /TAXON_ID=73915 /ORGANISM="Pyrodinium bahamense, Strain pbaha01" /LENGTH=601 /DNA_ID=CAMNT_0020907169 /DNA_START=105 /DNA_END=1907 /DNA_ORIENTATION=-
MLSMDGNARPAAPAATLKAMPPNGCEAAQMAHVRDSLLQHIQSVQKEITRLQAERERAQRSAQVLTCSPRVSLRAVPASLEQTSSASARLLENGVQWQSDLQATTCSSSGGGAACSTSGASIAVTKTSTAAAIAAAARIQRFWRKKATRCKCDTVSAGPDLTDASTQDTLGQSETVATGTIQSPEMRCPHAFAALNHAAARIQRAWKVSRWRRTFVAYSEQKVGWVGSLEWLQQRNMLYGTELAEPEDVRSWYENRADAPLDREVDPWGCTKLRDHLNKMWYGLTTEELQARYEELDREQQLEASACAAAATQEQLQLQQAWQPQVQQAWPPAELQMQQGRQVLHRLDAQAQNLSGTHASLRSPLRTERASMARLTAASSPAEMAAAGGKAASLSPRREARWVKGELTGHGRGSMKLLGAPPPSATSFASPSQVHRSTRLSTMPAMTSVVSQASMVLAQTTSSPSRMARPALESATSALDWQSDLPSCSAGAGATGAGPSTAAVLAVAPGHAVPLVNQPAGVGLEAVVRGVCAVQASAGQSLLPMACRLVCNVWEHSHAAAALRVGASCLCERLQGLRRELASVDHAKGVWAVMIAACGRR